MSFVLSNLHKNDQSNDIVSTIKQLVDDRYIAIFHCMLTMLELKLMN